CHTLWHHGVPAVGVPGASAWQEAWAEHLAGIAKIFVFVEPDAGGDAMLRWLAKSSIRARSYIVRLPTAKDPSELHVSDPAAFRAAWDSATARAKPWTDVARDQDAVRLRATESKCAVLARDADIPARLAEAMHAAGVVAEEQVSKF